MSFQNDNLMFVQSLSFPFFFSYIAAAVGITWCFLLFQTHRLHRHFSSSLSSLFLSLIFSTYIFLLSLLEHERSMYGAKVVCSKKKEGKHKLKKQ